ncbi:MAG: hypothetical protein KDA24_15735 [Deltaproteobacteria bacterium]|nr:hypothetical protein [Deltaproteobacteria bacterium]
MSTPEPSRRRELLASLTQLLNGRGLTLAPTDDPRRFRISGPSVRELLISPDNVFATILRDGDEGILAPWIDAILAGPGGLPPYLVARSGLRITLEPSDSEFGASLHSPLTPAIAEVLAYTDPEERRITWLSAASLDLWHASTTDVEEAARANMDKLLGEAELVVEEVRGKRLAMLTTDSAFKASLLRAPSLRSVVEPVIGWPVCAVAPCRDFLYLFSEADAEELIPMLAVVVSREFESSGYPLSAEVLKVSDEGVLALGVYED